MQLYNAVNVDLYIPVLHLQSIYTMDSNKSYILTDL